MVYVMSGFLPPYHHSSNGLVERAVQMFKNGFKKMSEGTVQEKLPRFLFSYHITPQTTTGMSPAELLMGRTIDNICNMDWQHA